MHKSVFRDCIDPRALLVGHLNSRLPQRGQDYPARIYRGPYRQSGTARRGPSQVLSDCLGEYGVTILMFKAEQL